MANIKSAKKRVRVTSRKTLANKSRKSELKTYIKKFEGLLEESKLNEAREMLKVVEKKLNRAALNNIIHKNTARRKISQLQLKLNRAS